MKKNKTLKTKAYRLKNGQSPLAYMLSSRHSLRSPLLYFDEEAGINRPLRYARNQKSPFEDEQDGNAILEPVVFEDGMQPGGDPRNVPHDHERRLRPGFWLEKEKVRSNYQNTSY